VGLLLFKQFDLFYFNFQKPFKEYWTITIFGQGSHLVLFARVFVLSFPLSFANTYGISVDFFS